MKRRWYHMVAAVILMVCVLPVPRAEAEDLFIDNEHWRETTASAVTQMFYDDESFVVMFYRSTCFNSNLRKIMVESWMEDYALDVYGVDVDSYSIPSWVWKKISGNSVTLPVICIVTDSGQYECFTAKDSMRRIQGALHEYLGIYDSAELDFGALNTRIYNGYSVRKASAYAQYCEAVPEFQAILEQEAIISAGMTDQEKAKAIYDWVTGNIYYDFGMLDGTSQRETSAMETYRNGRSVCEGYANLTAALCRAAGLPCRVVTGFAAGVGSDSAVTDVWAAYEAYLQSGNLTEFQTEMSQYENHAWNEVFVDGEWLIMDTTWGSNNDYYPGRGRIAGTPTDTYFDPDLDTFSETHLFWTECFTDLKVERDGANVIVSGVVEEADAADAELVLLVFYDERGKMLYCEILSLVDGAFSLTAAGTGQGTVKLFLLDGDAQPVAEPYCGAF